MIASSDLILNEDGSVYHLQLLPEDIASTIITVGDPDRALMVSAHFDEIILKKQKREFITHTGMVGSKKISVVSTGIGSDNVEIALTELDALVNIDLKKRIPKPEHTTLQFIRIGTSGGLQRNIPVDSVVISKYAVGMDNLMEFYFLKQDPFEQTFGDAFQKKLLAGSLRVFPYCVKASDSLLQLFSLKKRDDLFEGITVSCPGFYAPQGRKLRNEIPAAGFPEVLSGFSFGEHRLTNFEMETSSIYAMSRMLGHEAISLSTVVANRIEETVSLHPQDALQKLVEFVLKQLTS